VAAASVPIQYATTLDGVRVAYRSFGEGPPVIFASNIFGDLTGYRLGWPRMKEVTDRLVKLRSRLRYVIECSVRAGPPWLYKVSLSVYPQAFKDAETERGL
jgi:hypothetical protein